MSNERQKQSETESPESMTSFRSMIAFPRVRIIRETPHVYVVQYKDQTYEIFKSDQTHFIEGNGSSGKAEMGMSLQLKQKLSLFLGSGIFQDHKVDKKFAEVMIFHELREMKHKETTDNDDPLSAHQKAVHDEILYVLKHFAPAEQNEYFKFSRKYRKEKGWNSLNEIIKRVKNGERLDLLPEKYRRIKKVVLEAVKKDGWALQYASEKLRGDREVVLEAVKKDGWALQYASEKLRDDREVVLEAVKKDGRTLQFASEELRGNHEVVLEAVKRSGFALEYASEELCGDPEILKEVMGNSGWQAVLSPLMYKRENALRLVRIFGDFLEFAPENLRADREVVLEAVKRWGFALQYASEELRNDREIVVAAVKKNGDALKYASEELQSDGEIARIAKRIGSD